MALQKYIRQLRPIQENKVDYVERFQVLRENENSEIQAVIKSVEGGKIAEAVYESWAFIVAKTSGSKTLPTIKDVQSAMSKEEFNDKGKKWITDFLSKTEDNTFLLQAIELIGGDMKQIPNVNWGSVQVLHKSIDKYYENTPKKYAEGAKDNTSDMILITKGTVDNLLKALPDSDMSWTDDGRVAIDGTDIEFIQVSLKKGEEEARIGKLSSLINQIYGQQAMRPRQLTMSHSISEEIEQLEEGLRDIFGKAVGLIKLGASKLLDFSKKMFTKLRNSLIKAALKISKTITKDKAHKSSAKLANLMNTNLSENFIVEAKKVLPPVKINAPMMKEMKVLKNEIIKKDLANKEYKEMLKNVAALNSKKKGSIVVINKGTDPILEMKNFQRAANIVLERKLGSHITREELFPALKLCVNYASYKTFNTILEDMQKKIPEYEKAGNALVELNAKLKAEAMFGNTLLPLWIVYGMGGGAHYKGTRNEFADKSGEEIAKLGESMNVPYMVIQIGRSGGKQYYNSIYLLILSGSVKMGDEVKPEYVKLQFINRSGSGFSYKIDAMSTQVGY